MQEKILLQAAEKFGLPLYFYDGDLISQKINKIKEAFSGFPMEIKYACKANTNLSVLSLIKSHGVGADVVSPQEMHLALRAGFEAKNITFTSSGVNFNEIEECVENGILVNIDNLSTLEKFGKKYGNSVPVFIRIRPNIEGGGNIKISTGHKNSKFGIPVEQKADILKLVNQYNLKVIGLHQHTGSDVGDTDTFLKASHVLFELAFSFGQLEYLDFGGGFKVAYKEGDTVTDMNDLGEKLSEKYEQFTRAYGKKLTIWFEPGKYLVSESGYLLAGINVIKNNPNGRLIGLNTGLNHLIRPMMYDAYHEVVNLSRIGEEANKSYDIVGYMCETDDIAKNRLLPESKEDDIVAIKNAGAYGYSMASNYNSRYRPAEVLFYKNRLHLIREREAMEDLLKKQIHLTF